jgi:hypothetical protein
MRPAWLVLGIVSVVRLTHRNEHVKQNVTQNRVKHGLVLLLGLCRFEALEAHMDAYGVRVKGLARPRAGFAVAGFLGPDFHGVCLLFFVFTPRVREGMFS